MPATMFVLLTSLVFPAKAEWRKVIDCESGSAVMDTRFQGVERSASFQFVIRGPKAVDTLVRTGAVLDHVVNEKNEIVISVEENFPDYFRDRSWISKVSAYRPDGQTGRVYYVRPMGPELLFEAFEAKRWDPRAPYELGARVGQWTFYDCRHHSR